MTRGYLLQFREPDGSMASEVLYFMGESAGLVDPNGTPLSPSETFVMNGRTWRMVDGHVTEERVRIVCTAAEAPAGSAPPADIAAARRAAG